MTPYYDKDGITIYCGDCLEVMPTLSPTFDMILADLPYGTTACEWDSIIPLEPLWKNYKRLIKDRGAIVLTGSQPFTSKLVMSNFQWFKYEWIWDKVKPSGFQIAKHRPMMRQENIIVFGNGSITYNPITTKRKEKKISTAYTKSNSSPVGQLDLKSREYLELYPQSIIEFSNANQQDRFHPTQKPVALMSYLIRTYTNPGELILDNTMGSGTTLVAAQNEGRRAVGIELSEEYCKIAVDRLRQKSLFSIIKPESKEGHKQLSLV